MGCRGVFPPPSLPPSIPTILSYVTTPSCSSVLHEISGWQENFVWSVAFFSGLLYLSVRLDRVGYEARVMTYRDTSLLVFNLLVCAPDE